jgi:hypothetical protein
MARSFEDAVDRRPRNWYAHFELALAYAALDQRERALVQLGVARRLNPREPVIGEVRRDIVAGRAVDRAKIDRLFVDRVRGRVGR